MGIETEKYIRKPLYVDAVRVTAQNFDEIVAWCQGEVQTDEVPGQGTTKKFIKVRVHNPKNPRQTKAFIGDWILYTDRGYKVYTNKAFRTAFDLVVESAEMTAEQKAEFQGSPSVATPPAPTEQVNAPEIPKFYIGPESGELTEKKPGPNEVPLTLQELMNIVRNELVEDELQNPVEGNAGEVDIVTEQPQVAGSEETSNEEDDTPIAPPPTPAIIPPEPEARLQTETAPDEKIKHEPVRPSNEGKRILTEEEQRQMGQDKVRELIKTGDVILAQDVATQAA